MSFGEAVWLLEVLEEKLDVVGRGVEAVEALEVQGAVGRCAVGGVGEVEVAVAGHRRPGGRHRCYWSGRGLPTGANDHEAANHAIDLVITGIADKPERADLCRRKRDDRHMPELTSVSRMLAASFTF